MVSRSFPGTTDYHIGFCFNSFFFLLYNKEPNKTCGQKNITVKCRCIFWQYLNFLINCRFYIP